MDQQYDTIPIYSLKVVKERDLKYPVKTVPGIYTAIEVMKAYLEDQSCEHLAIILVDGQNNMIGISTITIGELSKLSVSVRSIFNHVIGGRASAFILGHNHPSGNVNPTTEDIVMTNAVLEACKIMGVPCLDHIIISSGTNSDYYSFSDKGLI